MATGPGMTARAPACCTTSPRTATKCGPCAPARSARWTSLPSANSATSPTHSPKGMCASPRAATSSSCCLDVAKVEPLIDELDDGGLSGRRHRQLRVHDLAHAGLAALRHSRHRRLGRREEPDGHAVRRIRPRGDAQSRAHHHLLLPDQLRRPGRYLHQRAIHQAAEDQPRSASPRSASARRSSRAARWRRSGRRW